MEDGRGDAEGRQQGPITLSLENRRLEEHVKDVTRFPRGRTPGLSHAGTDRPWLVGPLPAAPLESAHAGAPRPPGQAGTGPRRAAGGGTRFC